MGFRVLKKGENLRYREGPRSLEMPVQLITTKHTRTAMANVATA